MSENEPASTRRAAGASAPPRRGRGGKVGAPAEPRPAPGNDEPGPREERKQQPPERRGARKATSAAEPQPAAGTVREARPARRKATPPAPDDTPAAPATVEAAPVRAAAAPEPQPPAGASPEPEPAPEPAPAAAEAGAQASPLDSAALQADLVDMLQLELDALPMYALAISALRDPALRDTLTTFRDDHERHARELSALLREMGGIPPLLPHLPTGLLKLGVQAAGLPGGDLTILLGFISNEWQSREKYARYANKSYPPALASRIAAFAADEAKHYEWARDALRALGCGEDTAVGRAAQVFARAHGMTADVLEGIGRASLEATIRMSGRA